MNDKKKEKDQNEQFGNMRRKEYNLTIYRSLRKEEIYNLFNMDKKMYLIVKKKERRSIKGTEFFCKMNESFPIKYALFTNNHVLDEKDLNFGEEIQFECLVSQKSFFSSSYKKEMKKIKMNKKRKVVTNRKLDYTCIELFDSDGINDFFEIEPQMYTITDKSLLELYFTGNEIFNLYFERGENLSFSQGKILFVKNEYFVSQINEDPAASGCPIIRRCNDNYVIGLHIGTITSSKGKEKISIIFYYILYDIKKIFN